MTTQGTPQPRPGIMQIAAYVGGEGKLNGANRVIKLSSNEGALGPSPRAIAAYDGERAELHRYPDGGANELRAAIGAAFRIDPARIVCGAGSDDLLCLLTQAYGGPGTETIVTKHAFAMHPIYARYAGSTVVTAEERELTADVDAMLACVTPRTSLVLLANPNNPTGTMLPWPEVARLRAGLPANVLLVIDAAYAEYLPDPRCSDAIALVDGAQVNGGGANTVMTRTFSKIYGLGGLRLGWAYAPAGVVDVLNRVRSPFNASRPAQAAAIAALADTAHVEASRAHNARWRPWLVNALATLGVPVHGTEGNFVLADFAAAGCDAGEADAAFRDRGIIVRAMGGYGLPGCLRITIGTEDEMAAVAEAAGAFMARAARSLGAKERAHG
ncbi:histidinol-phosphate transaminase [Elioraea sp.]|uniref:pyridoxal phosphate-dependent aminotransferase n=1 Tax=Elioraea sp. TaxID=2185103 RepID=UPI0025C667C5|nr:histidinol-phosphate transaminase [Elioraea sp.]